MIFYTDSLIYRAIDFNVTTQNISLYCLWWLIYALDHIGFSAGNAFFITVVCWYTYNSFPTSPFNNYGMRRNDGSLDVNLEFNGDFKDSSTVCFEINDWNRKSRRETCGLAFYDTCTLQMDFMRGRGWQDLNLHTLRHQNLMVTQRHWNKRSHI